MQWKVSVYSTLIVENVLGAKCHEFFIATFAAFRTVLFRVIIYTILELGLLAMFDTHDFFNFALTSVFS